MLKRNTLIFCLILSMYQSLSWPSSKDDINNLREQFKKFIQDNKNHELAIFANPHGQENLRLQFISYIGTPDESIYVSNPGNTNWQHLALVRFGSHVFTNVGSYHLVDEQTLTLTRYFYTLCCLQIVSPEPISILLGKISQQLQYVTEKSLTITFESYATRTLTFPFGQYQPSTNYKLLIAPYNIQQNFFEEDNQASVEDHREPNPELSWDNVERYMKTGRYKEEDGKRYLRLLFKYDRKFVCLRFKLHIPEADV